MKGEGAARECETKFCKHTPLPIALCRDARAANQYHTAGGQPIIPIMKKGGGTRIYANHKISVLQVDTYHLPCIEEPISKLQGGVEFTKIGLSRVYQRGKLDESSKFLTTIIKHKGLLSYNIFS